MKLSLPLDATTFACLVPRIRSELARRVRCGTLSVAESLQQVFIDTFGARRSREELIRFLLLAAPLARRLVIELAPAGAATGGQFSLEQLKLWLWWLDTMDPRCARMIDLHYFAGLSITETALALDLPPEVVARDLRFARAWMQRRMQDDAPALPAVG